MTNLCEASFSCGGVGDLQTAVWACGFSEELGLLKGQGSHRDREKRRDPTLVMNPTYHNILGPKVH